MKKHVHPWNPQPRTKRYLQTTSQRNTQKLLLVFTNMGNLTNPRAPVSLASAQTDWPNNVLLWGEYKCNTSDLAYNSTSRTPLYKNTTKG